MQKRGWFDKEMDKEYEETLLGEIRKRDNKIQTMISVISSLVALHVIMLILILFYR